jgi:hypothetical protein
MAFNKNKSEDDIIAESFILIKEGILNGDWIKVCEAYENISGEKIEPPVKTETRLEKIRKVLSKSNKSEKVNSKKPVKNNKKNKNEVKVNIISTEEDEDEKQFNMKLAAKSKREVVKRSTEIANLHNVDKNPNADIRVNINARRPSDG